MVDQTGLAPWDEGFEETEQMKKWREEREAKEAAALQGDRSLEINDQDESKSKATIAKPRNTKYANMRSYMGYELKEGSDFVNLVDAKPLDLYGRYFQVSPAYFAQRCMMKTATVRKLLAERKLPKIYDGDHVRVIVSALWLGGLPGEEAWKNFNFEPEDNF